MGAAKMPVLATKSASARVSVCEMNCMLDVSLRVCETSVVAYADISTQSFIRSCTVHGSCRSDPTSFHHLSTSVLSAHLSAAVLSQKDPRLRGLDRTAISVCITSRAGRDSAGTLSPSLTQIEARQAEHEAAGFDQPYAEGQNAEAS